MLQPAASFHLQNEREQSFQSSGLIESFPDKTLDLVYSEFLSRKIHSNSLLFDTTKFWSNVLYTIMVSGTLTMAHSLFRLSYIQWMF